MKAAIHLGSDFLTNSEIYENTKFEEIWSVFNITQKKKKKRKILNKFCLCNAWNINHHHGRDQYWPMNKRSNGRRLKYVSTLISVLCVGQEKDISGATERWSGQSEDLKKCSSYQDAVGIDGEAIEFEWTFSQDFRH